MFNSCWSVISSSLLFYMKWSNLWCTRTLLLTSLCVPFNNDSSMIELIKTRLIKAYRAPVSSAVVVCLRECFILLFLTWPSVIYFSSKINENKIVTDNEWSRFGATHEANKLNKLTMFYFKIQLTAYYYC